MQEKGQRSLDIFALVMGIVLGAVVGLVFLLRMTVLENSASMQYNDPEMQAEAAARLAPIGQVVLLGDAALQAAPPPAPTPARVATTLSGPQVYNEACYLCHADPGVGGAPVFGDQAAWADRITQGIDVLTEHVINGFQGSTGVMPPKGGRLDLSDEEVRSAVQFMIDEVGGQ